jgi:hypothetical protein
VVNTAPAQVLCPQISDDCVQFGIDIVGLKGAPNNAFSADRIA